MISLTNLLAPLADNAWFSSDTATYLGAYGGALLGSVGGILGAGAGLLVPRGKAKGVVLPALAAFALFGVLSAAAALVALVSGQPWHVTFPLALIGVILCSVMIPLFFVTKNLYMQFENRKLEADALRQR